MFSLRELMWSVFYGGGLPPEGLLVWEILACLGVGVIIVLCWFPVRMLFFLISEKAKVARAVAWVFCISWAWAWVVGGLELFALWTITFVFWLSLLSLIGSIGYLIWVKAKA